MISIVFFGSFQNYSVFVLDKLHHHPDFQVVGVVTTPPKVGNRNILTKTLVHQYGESHHLPVFPLDSLDTIPITQKPDFLVVAGYGKKITPNWLQFPKYLPVNFHPSLLPEYAGRFPAEWAILRGETITGVTLIKISENFNDNGDILSQIEEPISTTDTKETLYKRLYENGTDLIINTLPKIISQQIIPLPQYSTGFYARQITKDDGFVSPSDLLDTNYAPTLDKKTRALLPWPGVWTNVCSKDGQNLIMKIFSFNLINQKIELRKVQIEGKKPTLWSEISAHYFLTK